MGRAFTFKKKEKRKKKSLASRHIFGLKGQLLFDTVLISGGEDQILVLMYRFFFLNKAQS